jgi:hypothetical protein
MTVDFNDFATFAEPLQGGASEIDWRMAAGRAYYAAYHRARSSADLCPNNDAFAMGSHERVSDRFMRDGSRPAKSIAYILISMKKFRKLADYDLDETFDQSAAVNQIAQYRVFLNKLNEFDQAALKSA